MEAVIRESKRRLLSLIHDVQSKAEQFQVNRHLKYYDASVIENEPPKQAVKVLFIITRMVRFHGGQTSILRLGTEFSKLGYKTAYAVYKPQSREEMQICAKSNLEGFMGSLLTKDKLEDYVSGKKNVDIIIATSWDTVSAAKKISGYKMYFVQDFEPYFYSYGELYLMAKKTYEQGLHMVSLGAWNKEMIEKLCKAASAVDVVDFPYEKSEYPEADRDYNSYKDKKKLVFAVYLKIYGKRLPCIVQYMMQEITEYFRRDGIELDVRYFGEAKTFHAIGGTNYGMLSKAELSDLYREADFGITASLSNISLVPYEMLSTGLPLIEFEDGTFPYFFPENTAILSSISGFELYNKIKVCINNPHILYEHRRNAKKAMEQLSWKKTGEQFKEIVDKTCVK